ncbi:hypothetical protein ACSFA8_26990 [Variovorax sp. RT4R15]
MLLFERDRQLDMRALLFHVETGEEIMSLNRAGVVKAGHGGGGVLLGAWT